VPDPEPRRTSFRARCRAWLLDSSWTAFFRGVIAASLLLKLVVAYRSLGFYNCDEHFQILEFMGLKLGTTAPADLAWEFHAEVRSWLQPALYYPFAKLFFALGGQDPLRLAWLLRTLSALLSWASLCAFGRSLPRFIRDGIVRRATLLALNFFYLVPTLGVRTSSENFSQAFLLFGLAALVEPGRFGASLYPSAPDDVPAGVAEASVVSPLMPSLWLAGMSFGLAFLARYQAAVLVAGAAAWFLVHGRARRAFALGAGSGFVLVLALGVVLDRWGYGHWVYVPWRYLRSNLLEGRASAFGRSPVWGYVTLFATKLWPPFGLLWLSVIVLAAWRLPRHLLTWTVLPFVVMHHAIAHKEARFLFPTLAVCTVLGGLLFAGGLAANAPPERRRRWGPTLGAVLLGMNAIGIVLYGLMPTNQRWTLLDALDGLAPDGYTLLTANGFQPISTCNVRAPFYWGKRKWRPYARGTGFIASDERGLPVFYGWAGTPANVFDNPFAARCTEIAPHFWVASPLARAAWSSAPLSTIAEGLSSYAVYRCPATARVL
jgi:Alg9-like mannosyltransferase family